MKCIHIQLAAGEIAVGEVVTGEIVLGKLRWGSNLTPYTLLVSYFPFKLKQCQSSFYILNLSCFRFEIYRKYIFVYSLLRVIFGERGRQAYPVILQHFKLSNLR